MTKELIETAKNIIEDISYITLASVSENGQPWNSPLFSAYDDEYNFYWGSSKESQHSQNIMSNPKVFLSIYNSTVPAMEGEGVYIQALASELTSPDEIEKTLTLLQDRQPYPYPWALNELNGDSPIRLYKATPTEIWMNTDSKIGDHFTDTRKSIDLNQ